MNSLDMLDPTGWSALLLGLFVLFAATGALRKPGIWQTMVGEFERSPALQLTASLLELLTGTLVYLANPWAPDDLLTCVMKGLGGLMMIEALVVVGFSDIYFHFWLRNLAHMHRGWAICSFLGGFALAVLGVLRSG
jgi:hypothetical protein